MASRSQQVSGCKIYVIREASFIVLVIFDFVCMCVEACACSCMCRYMHTCVYVCEHECMCVYLPIGAEALLQVPSTLLCDFVWTKAACLELTK